MKYNALTITEYFDALPEDRRPHMLKLFQTIEDHIAPGFKPILGYHMPTWVVPFERYAAGYHCPPRQPLPFLSIASQKNFIALYHMGLYADPVLYQWFVGEYPKHVPTKLDMGKSCIRFKKPEHLPFELIAELVSRMDAETWIGIYETLKPGETK